MWKCRISSEVMIPASTMRTPFRICDLEVLPRKTQCTSALPDSGEIIRSVDDIDAGIVKAPLTK